MRAKQFFYTSAGILLLVIAYSVGARSVDAQGSAQFTGISTYGTFATAITANGDVYARYAGLSCIDGTAQWYGYGPIGSCPNDPGWQFVGNVLGGTIATTPATMSGVKQEYRK